jgi:Domain of unknown function (DUF4351)
MHLARGHCPPYWLTRKLGKINPQLRSRISSLKIEQVESLGEALLDFSQIADLEAWLGQN